jgi:ABC-2 type transport system ATP-binding protein
VPVLLIVCPAVQLMRFDEALSVTVLGTANTFVSFPSVQPALAVSTVSKYFETGPRLRLPWRTEAPRRRTVAVDNVSLNVGRGEIFGILGANGSGKSTLIRLISTLLLPDIGTLEVFGVDVVKDELRVKQLINRVSVDAAFFKKLSPMENLLYAGRLYGLGAQETHRRGLEVLGRLNIGPRVAFEPMENMSRGMQQKVAIARALLTSPVLLLLDEPTTGLDPRSKKDVQRLVLGLRQAHDATVVLTTHDMDEADRLCDRVAVLDRGQVIALDTPGHLKQAGGSLEDVFMRLTHEEESAA